MTIEETGKIMEIIRLMYPRHNDMSDEDAKKTLSLWASLLQDIPYKEVSDAVKAYLMTDKTGFPPSIGEINGLICKAKTSNLPSGDEAWALVRNAIGNGLYGAKEEFDNLPAICQKVVATPVNLYDWAHLGHEGLNVVRTTFLKQYKAVIENTEYLLALPEKSDEKAKKLTDDQAKIKTLTETIIR
ncbi:MAG: hypothetical protein IJI56_02515 [Firmicutes bacterium]|nr:hypothetical protein [Bacillota bacterium]